MARFLRHVVEASLAGDEAALKESSIGVAVFDREPTYNPKEDPVVRSEARRLREKLQRYYDREGQADTVLIHLPKGGYTAQFEIVAALEVAVEEPVSGLPAPALPPPPRRSRIWVVALLVGMTLGASGMALLRGLHKSVGPLHPVSVYPLTSLPGQELDPTLSPDGKQVAFSADSGTGNFDLFVVGTDGGEPRRLTASADRDLHPAFSPDGQTIAFLRASSAGIEVWTIGVDGRNATKISEIRWFEWFNWRSDLLFSTGYPGPSWVPDGKSLILADVSGTQQGAALWEFEMATGSRRQVTRPANLAHDFFPSVSPDGRHIAFVRQFSASTCDLFVVDRRTGEERRLTTEARDVRGLAWMPDGRSLVYSSTRNGAYQLWRLFLSGGAGPEPVAAPGDRLLTPTISRDGRLLAYTSSTINVNLWRQPLDGRGPARPLVVSSGSNLFPRYSPDGRRIAWASDRTNGWEIWVADADGSRPRQLTRLAHRSSGRLLGTPRWSPDGQWIAFDARVSPNCGIYLVPSAGGEPRLLERNQWEERNPSFSRDGRWIYFNSNRGGTVQVWRRPVAGGPPVRLTTRRGYDAAESPDGRTVYFLPALAEPGIWRVSPDGSGESMLLAAAPFLVRRHWDVVGGRLYFLGHDAEPRTVMRLDPAGGNPERVLTLDRELIADINSLSVSPDGLWLLYARPDRVESNLMAVVLQQARGTP